MKKKQKVSAWDDDEQDYREMMKDKYFGEDLMRVTVCGRIKWFGFAGREEFDSGWVRWGVWRWWVSAITGGSDGEAGSGDGGCGGKRAVVVDSALGLMGPWESCCCVAVGQI